MEYSNFRKLVDGGDVDHYLTFKKALDYSEKMFDISELKGFYAKDLVNKEMATELFFFIPEGILTVLVENKRFSCLFNRSKILSKEILVEKYTNEEHVLKLTLENGASLEFNNINDSNIEWSSEYARYLKDLYLVI